LRQSELVAPEVVGVTEPVAVGVTVGSVALPPAPQLVVGKVNVRFAEDILSAAKPAETKKKKKGSTGKESDEDIAARRLRRAGAGADYATDEDEEF
jgi:hypothetical protein